jgi:hypothetical protein
MNQVSEVNPLRANEALYRRIPDVWKDLRLDAFLPHKSEDVDGLSLSREAVGPQGAAATGILGKIYHVAQAVVCDVEQIGGLTVFADSDAHALIPEMNSALRQSTNSVDKEKRKEWARALQLLFRSRQLFGPYKGAN